jgi:hypothetical protein
MIGAKRPTKGEWEWMGRCKAGPCIACLVGVSIGMIQPEHACRGGDADDGLELPMMQFNHCKSGNLRRGHRHGYALCLWHHFGSQQLHALGMSYADALERWGWNLFDSANLFHATFGSDDDLIEAQAFVLDPSACCCDSV